MREIKFRAWDLIDHKMIAPHGGYFIGWHAPSNWRDCYKFMQFTGLLDKNGVEIYEGDIVKCGWYYGDDFGNEVGEMEFSNQVVEFTVGPQGSGFDLNVFGMDNAEVIGNIYEEVNNEH